MFKNTINGEYIQNICNLRPKSAIENEFNNTNAHDDSFFMNILNTYIKPEKVKKISQINDIYFFKSIFQNNLPLLQISKQNINNIDKIELIQKLYFQFKINHKAIMRPIKLSISPQNRFESYFCYPEKGPLTNYIGFSHDCNFQSIQNLTSTQKTIISYGIADALRVIHHQGYQFGNVNAVNVYLDSNFHPLLTNFFGIKNIKDFYGHSKSSNDIKFNEFYLKIDVYSYSIIYAALIEPIELNPPANSAKEFYQRLACRERPVCKKATKKQREILDLMWNCIPKNRINFDQVIENFNNGNLIFPDTEMDEFERYKKFINNICIQNKKVEENNPKILETDNFDNNQNEQENKRTRNIFDSDENNDIKNNGKEQSNINDVLHQEKINVNNCNQQIIPKNSSIETLIINESRTKQAIQNIENINDEEEEDKEEEDDDDDEEDKEEEDLNDDNEEDTTDYSNIPIINLNNYKFVKKLGEGNFGCVQLVQDIRNGKLYAAKISKKRIKSRKEKKQFYSEIKSQLQANGPSVLKLIGINMKDFKRHNHPTIITEYIPNKSLRDNFDDEYKSLASHDFTSTKKYIILLGIALGMKHLHFQGIIHRDLKPDNILLDENFYPYICDFGFSEVSDFLFLDFQSKFNKNCGTPLYMAPEILENNPYTYKVDVYSFSLIAYELITGIFPFNEDKDIFNVYMDILSGNHPDLSIIKDESISKFIEKCWSTNPSIRPTFNEIVEELMQEKYINYFEADKNEVDEYLLLFDDYIKTFNSSSDIASNLKKLADEGDSRSLLNYGIMLINGDIIKRNAEEGVRYVKLAADKGYGIAYHLYGTYCLLGIGMKPNPKEAIPYFKKSAELKNTFGLYSYGDMLLNGYYVQDDIEKGIEYIKLAADRGNVAAIYSYAEQLYQGDKIEQNYEEAIHYFKKAADINQNESLYMYAYMNENGIGTPINKELASIYYKKAAENGHAKSKYKLGKLYLEKDASELTGIDYLFQASELDDDDALFDLGFWSLKGIHLNVDKEKAAEFFEKSADLGNEKACYYFARMLHLGDGIKKDISKAFYYYEIAAFKGNLDAYLYMGIILFNGELGERDIENGLKCMKISADKGNTKAISIYEKSMNIAQKLSENSVENIRKRIEKGDTEAMHRYAVMLTLGENVEKNINESLKYFQMAADNGNLNAAEHYGIILVKGFGVNPDPEKGLKYIKMAADNGVKNAIEAYGTLLFQGIRVPFDLQETAFYLRKASDLGSIRALHCYASLLSIENELQDDESPNYIAKSKEEKIDLQTLLIINEFKSLYREEKSKLLKQKCDSGDIDSINKLINLLNKGERLFIDEKDILSYLLQAIEKDNAEAMLLYGKMLYKEDNKSTASQYYKKSADHDNIEAMLLYANMLKEGDGIPIDEDEAIKYYKMCADKGNSEAMLILAKIYYKREENSENKTMSSKYYKKSADHDNIEAMLLYANMLKEGDGIPIDEDEAIKYYKMCADKGDSEAMLILAKIYYKREENEVLKLETFDYLQMSADKGNLEALFLLANMLKEGDGMIPQPETAKQFYEVCIENGNEEAIYKYGEILAKEKHFPKNDNESLYLKKTADKGNLDAIYLYSRYLSSINKFKEAAHYMKLVVDKRGNPEDFLKYAKMLHDGKGVEVDKKEAARYFEMAALKNDNKGAYEYAEILYKGDGIEENKKKAADFYKIAADNGNIEAMKKLGDMLSYGDGIQMNKKEGKKYHQKAIDSEKKYQENKELVLAIASYLNPYLEDEVRENDGELDYDELKQQFDRLKPYLFE